MSKAVIIEKNGGPEELKIVDVTVGQPGAGEIRIRHKAVGLNFIDVYQRTGLYPFPMPLRLGMEASGIVEAVGEGVTHLKVGDRAAYASQPPGSYCEERVMPAKTVCKLPDAISFETGAAMMLKGLTAQYLLKRTLPQGGLHKGDFILFHAAAGGVGLIASQWAKALGYQLIGTAGSDAKCKLALDNGASHAINYNTEDFLVKVKEITGGKGVNLAINPVGGGILAEQIECLAYRGRLAIVGYVDGQFSAPLDIGTVHAQRLRIFGVSNKNRTSAERTSSVADFTRRFLPIMAEKGLTPVIDRVFPFDQLPAAREHMQADRHVGKVVLQVD